MIGIGIGLMAIEIGDQRAGIAERLPLADATCAGTAVQRKNANGVLDRAGDDDEAAPQDARPKSCR
jgi:hypothetical protein